jgi:hypothetical protein
MTSFCSQGLLAWLAVGCREKREFDYLQGSISSRLFFSPLVHFKWQAFYRLP